MEGTHTFSGWCTAQSFGGCTHPSLANLEGQLHRQTLRGWNSVLVHQRRANWASLGALHFKASFLPSNLSVFNENYDSNLVCTCIKTSAENVDFQRLSKGQCMWVCIQLERFYVLVCHITLFWVRLGFAFDLYSNVCRLRDGGRGAEGGWVGMLGSVSHCVCVCVFS